MSLRAVPDVPRRAVAYVRVSDEGGRGEDLMSPQIQLAAIKDHCARRGYQLVKVLEDIDLTGRFWKRRQIEQAVKMIEAGDADVVVVWKISRVARNRLDWNVAVDRVEVAGGTMESATEPIDASTSTGRFTRGVLAELAAFESERIGEGWVDAFRQRFEAGLPVNGRVPWGWTAQRRRLTPDPEKVPVVREMYSRYLSGEGLVQIAQWLTATGRPTATGVRWSAAVVRSVLDNPIHAGMVSWRGEVRQGAHDPIIDAATWEAYLAARGDRRRWGRRERSQYLLAGLIRCGVCGYAMVGAVGSRGRAPRYRCHQAQHGAHRPGSILLGLAEAAVRDWLTGLAGRLDAATDAVPAVVDRVDTAVVEASIIDLDRKLARLTEHLVSGLVPESAYKATRDEVQARRAELVGELSRLRRRQVLASTQPAQTAADLLGEWETLTVQARRAVLRTLVDRVVVTPPSGVLVVPVWSEE